MATGDDAVAAGMTLVDGSQADANTIDTLINQSRDYIAQGKLKDFAVAGSKLADAAVTARKIGNGEVTASKLADGSVVTARIADAAVTKQKIADIGAPNVAGPDKIPVYNSAGQLTVTLTPTITGHATSKGYVDARLAELVERVEALAAEVARLRGD